MYLTCFGKLTAWAEWLHSKDETVYLNHTFQKQSWLSQYEIMTAQGPLKLSVPIIKASRQGAYRQVALSFDSNWQVEQWRSIENAYQKSPFFIFYNYKIEPVFKAKYVYLYEFNLALFRILNECVKTRKNVELDEVSEVYYENSEKFIYPKYPQVFDDKQAFASDLCLLDVLFNFGPEALDYIKQLP